MGLERQRGGDRAHRDALGGLADEAETVDQRHPQPVAHHLERGGGVAHLAEIPPLQPLLRKSALDEKYPEVAKAMDWANKNDPETEKHQDMLNTFKVVR